MLPVYIFFEIKPWSSYLMNFFLSPDISQDQVRIIGSEYRPSLARSQTCNFGAVVQAEIAAKVTQKRGKNAEK